MSEKSPKEQRVRLIDVADAANVTKSVVSRVLSGDPTLAVRDETRDRILALAANLAYEPHAGAKALAGSRSKALALLIPDLTTPVYARIARGAYQRARERGYVVLLAEDREDSQSQSDYTDLVSAGRVDGLLIASSREGHPLLADGRLRTVPHVFVNRTVPDSGRNVSINQSSASANAYRFLFERGHRKIGHISGTDTLSPAVERERGFDQAASDLGAEKPMVVRDDFLESGGYRSAELLMREHPEITALYAGTFSQSVGALKALRDLGIQVPEDVSVLSNDDLPLANYLVPSLSAMAMPLDELGRLAVDTLVDQLEGKAVADVVLEHDAVAVERGSTARARPSP
ncbi:LacI family DNA-binding transcriptional regulator [Cryobacterium sp. Hz7]|uniref:LacI family DNA-binding transcriptional regulator n=1 Tax=Cryobacterium sp. Hz7 TaxID=1259166 RepID=UPI00141A81E8|nr:LacI family DNA-binding transcriptional regulator [Cryobacterium sp. Hz7]